MLREKATTTTREPSTAFDSIIQDSGSFPEYYNMNAEQYLCHIMGKTAMYADRAVAPRPAAVEIIIEPAETTEFEKAPEVPAEPETSETEPDTRGRVGRTLGRIATAPLRAAGWINKMHYVGVATVIGKMPGKLTKEELVARDQARQEKFAVHEDDGFVTRTRKLLGRNAVRAAAWMPTIAMGALGASSIFRPFVGELHEVLPTADMPVANGVVSRALTPADMPSAAVVPPVPALHDAIIPAPQPSYTDLPDVKHKTDWQPPQKPVVSTPHPAPIEKPAPAPSGGDIVIPVGGATDPDGNMVADTLDPNKARIIRMNYPAEMGPFVGSTPTNVSQAIGVQNIIDLVKQHPGAKITLKGFSEGSFVTNEAARQLADMGIHVNVVNAGDGNGAAGILNHPLAQTFQPMVNGLGIYKTPPVPGSTELLSGRDAWASTAGDDPGRLLDKFTKIPVDHRIPGDNEIPVQIFTKDGVTYKVFDEPVPLPEGAVDMTPGGSPVPLPPPIEQLPLPVPMDQPAPADIPAPIDQPPIPDPAPIAPEQDDGLAPVIPFPAPPAPDQELAPAA